MILIWPLLKSNRRARFWAVGMHLSVLPVCATMPMNRNLLWVGIGACGLVGHFLGGFIAKESWVPQKKFRLFLTKMLVITLLVVHIPLALIVRIASPVATTLMVNKVKETMDVNSPSGFENQELVVVNAPNPAAFFYLPFAKAYEGETLPKGMRVLAPAFAELQVKREDEKSITLRAKYGNLLSCKPDHILDIDVVYMLEAISSVRSNGNGLHDGDEVELHLVRPEQGRRFGDVLLAVGIGVIIVKVVIPAGYVSDPPGALAGDIA